MSDELVQVEISVTADMADPAVAELVNSGGVLTCSVDASDIVSGLNNNDGLILAFIRDILDQAGSSELRNDLVDDLCGDSQAAGDDL